MHCREFAKKHLAFVDDTLSAVDTAAMQRHLRVCASCARRDACIRRGLLLARNLPPIQPSPDFLERLNARIRDVGPIDRFAVTSSYRLLSVGTFSAVAASIMTIAALAGALLYDDARDEILSLPPVIATIPEPEPAPAPVASPVYAASFMTGIPVWPAVMQAGEASLHMVNVELRQAVDTRE